MRLLRALDHLQTKYSFSSSDEDLMFLFQSRTGPCVHEAGGRDGRHLGSRRGLVGSRWSSIHLVLHRHDKRVPGRADLRGSWLPAPGPRRLEKDLQQEPEDQRWKAGKRTEHHQSRDAQHGRQRHSESEHEDRSAGNHLLSDFSDLPLPTVELL